MSTTWTIAIDWDRDGWNSDGAPNDDYENVTNRVISANWFLGTRVAYEEIANESTLDLVLDNQDRRFSPEYTLGPLVGKVVPQRPVRIQSYDGTTTRTHWVGWIDTIEPAVNHRGKRVVHITAIGAMQFLKAAETKLELQENKRTDEVIAELIKEVMLPPALNRAWILGRYTNSRLGETTWLANTSAYSALDSGKLTLGMAADNWVIEGGAADKAKDNFDVYRAIRDITAAEHGKFLFSREGKALFWNRHALLKGIEPPGYDPAADPPPPLYVASTFDDTMSDMAYSYANIDQCKNEIIVACHPRKMSLSTNDVLWELGDSIIRVEPGKTREVYIKYEDEDGKRVGAREVTVTDVEFEEGSAAVTVEAKANGANLKFVNNGTQNALVKKCVVKGRKIVDSGEMEAKATNLGSMIDYGRRTMRINLPSIDSLEHAQYIADFERDRRSQPKGEVSAITVLSHGTKSSVDEEDPNYNELHKRQLELTLGDVVTVKETQTAHERNYYIIGEAHELTVGATLWKTTWYLEPAPNEYPWRLGVTGRSELGDKTHLAY